MESVTTIRAKVYRPRGEDTTILQYAGDADIVVSSIAAVITEDGANSSGSLYLYLIREYEYKDGTVHRERDTAHRVILNSGLELFIDERGLINVERYISSGKTLEEREEQA